MTKLLKILKRIIPSWVVQTFRPIYHFALAWLGAVYHQHPSKEITVIAVTGTKGKTTVTELIAHMLRIAGHSVAVSNTIHFQIKDEETRNLRKMSMPGRFFLQRFLRGAVTAGCDYTVVEMTSEGAKQFRHRFIHIDTLVFTNLSPEHIESHGSFEKYRAAKVSIAKQVARSEKSPTTIIANADDQNSEYFLAVDTDRHLPFRLADAEPFSNTRSGASLTINHERVQTNLFGEFNIYNMMAAAATARAHGVKESQISQALQSFPGIRGRLERIDSSFDFSVYVDYAHTPDSLRQVYETFTGREKVCVLGNAGGGRDTWKRKEMAKLAENHCRHIILTDEDPYDENPRSIVEEMAKAITIPKYQIIMNRRQAIRAAFEEATAGDVVLLTGKGTDPYIMRENGRKEPWDEATVAREELRALKNKRDEE
ncbi:MAG: UDP-N-acetylmuramyl-tripeptide synthetase [Candidatus Paceibacterota bacterium]